MRHGVTFTAVVATILLCFQTGKAQSPDDGSGGFDHWTCLGITTSTTTDMGATTTTTERELNQYYNGSDDCIGFLYLVGAASFIVFSLQLTCSISASYWCFTESKRLGNGLQEPHFGFWSVLCCLYCTIGVACCPIDPGCDPPKADDELVGPPVRKKPAKQVPYRDPNRITIEKLSLTSSQLWREEHDHAAPLDTECKACQKAWAIAEWSPHFRTAPSTSPIVAWGEPKKEEKPTKDDLSPRNHFKAAVATEKRRHMASMGRLEMPP